MYGIFEFTKKPYSLPVNSQFRYIQMYNYSDNNNNNNNKNNNNNNNYYYYY